MSECESVVKTLLLEECPRRKKRDYNNVALEELREEQLTVVYGERVKHNIVRSPLPEVGTLIKMTEVLQFVRAHEWDEPTSCGHVLIPYPNTSHTNYSMTGVSSKDEEKVYEVIGYTGDTSNPFKSNLKMIFRNVYPVSNYQQDRSVPTRMIACGHIRYKVISPKEIMNSASQAEKDVDES